MQLLVWFCPQILRACLNFTAFHDAHAIHAVNKFKLLLFTTLSC